MNDGIPLPSKRPDQGTAVPEFSVRELVREQARRRPDAPAADGLSYRDLDRWAGQVARALGGLGLGPGTPVALRLPPGPPYLAALLGILEAGCHALPLGLSDAPERCIGILGEAGAECLLVDSPAADDELAGWVRNRPHGHVVAVPAPARTGTAPPRLPVPAADAPAYLVHTSGSTGRPKGILQSHGALAQFVTWMGAEFRMGAGRRVALWASPHYDACLVETLAPLVSGGTVCPVPQDVRLDPDALVHWLADQEVHVLQTVPSFARELLRALTHGAAGRKPPALDHLLLAGEPLPGDLATSLSAALPGLRLVNLYGATETILATWLELDRDWPGIVPVGRPIPGRDVTVRDATGAKCPAGVTGEIVVHSRFLALGYTGRDGRLTSGLRRLPDPTGSAEDDVPYYRTGDFGRWSENGLLEFQGRRDRQVKLRGQRIEPTEIEAALSGHPTVRACAVLPAEADGPVQSLVAYVVADAGSPDEWRAHLRGLLNEQMLPSEFVPVPALPRNAGGKVDESALRSLRQTAPPRGRATRSSRLSGFRSWAAQMQRDDGADV
ncbi:amino acid adenylation domain-containing protein [Streptomyces sp. NPDC046727]|uniref:amino acid adenylation domain-containing protein n=1 Tax=Streptomyces sp. NPDC046727 TaxID=3155373 RepID=UPI0033CFFF7E